MTGGGGGIARGGGGGGMSGGGGGCPRIRWGLNKSDEIYGNRV